jgi:hypothetical protein
MPRRFFVGTMRRRWHDSAMNPMDPAADSIDVRKLTPAMVERLKDPAVLQNLVCDLMALIRQERQEMQQLQQVVDLLEGLLSPPADPSVPRQQKRRQH